MKTINHTNIKDIFARRKVKSKDYVTILRDCEARPVDGEFQIYYKVGSTKHLIAIVKDDLDVVLYDLGEDGKGNITVQNRYNALSGAYVGNDSKLTKCQTIRVRTWVDGMRGNYPLTSGMIIRAGINRTIQASVLNPEIWRDYKRVLCRNKRKELYPRIEQVAKTLQVCAALGEIPDITWQERSLPYSSLYDMAEEDPHTVGTIIYQRTSGWTKAWNYRNSNDDNTKKNMRLAQARTAIRAFTEEVYVNHDAYKYEEITL